MAASLVGFSILLWVGVVSESAGCWLWCLDFAFDCAGLSWFDVFVFCCGLVFGYGFLCLFGFSCLLVLKVVCWGVWVLYLVVGGRIVVCGFAVLVWVRIVVWVYMCLVGLCIWIVGLV